MAQTAARQHEDPPHMQRDRVQYSSRIRWTGCGDTGTSSYTGHGRAHDIVVAGKPVLAGSADPALRGDAARHNPEDLFLAAVSSCHMLTYLALCARHGIVVLAYEDHAHGSLAMFAGGGRTIRGTDALAGSYDHGSGTRSPRSPTS